MTSQKARKAETRTKIQLGGLILKSGLADKLGIKVGDDLQDDILKRDAAYALLGMLAEMDEQMKIDDVVHYSSKGRDLANKAT